MKKLLSVTSDININDLNKFYEEVKNQDCFALDTISSVLCLGWESSRKFLAQLEFMGAIEKCNDELFDFVEVFENYTSRVFVFRSSDLATLKTELSIVDGPEQGYEYRFTDDFKKLFCNASL